MDLRPCLQLVKLGQTKLLHTLHIGGILQIINDIDSSKPMIISADIIRFCLFSAHKTPQFENVSYLRWS